MGEFDKLLHSERTPDAINIVQTDARKGQAHLRIQSSLWQRGTKRRKVIRARPQVSELLARRRQARRRAHDVAMWDRLTPRCRLSEQVRLPSMVLRHEKDRRRILSEQLNEAVRRLARLLHDKGARIVEAEAGSSTSFWAKHGGTSRVAAFANFERRALALASYFNDDVGNFKRVFVQIVVDQDPTVEGARHSKSLRPTM